MNLLMNKYMKTIMRHPVMFVKKHLATQKITKSDPITLSLESLEVHLNANAI